MNVHADLSFVNLILNASVVVQAVVLMLVLLSLWSWWQIFLKLFQLRRAARDTDRFEDEFWKGGDLAELYQRTSQSRTEPWRESASESAVRDSGSTWNSGSECARAASRSSANCSSARPLA